MKVEFTRPCQAQRKLFKKACQCCMSIFVVAAADSQAAKQGNRRAAEGASPITGKTPTLYGNCDKGENR